MGKGDKKSKRGKLFKGSYGVRRRKKNDKPVTKLKNKEEVVKEIKEVKEVKEVREPKESVAAAHGPKTKAAPAKKESKPKKQETT